MIGAGAAAHTARPLLAPTAVAVPVQTGHASPDSSVQGQGVDPLPRPPNAVAKCTGKARISVLRRAVRRMKQPKRRAVPRLSCREPFLEGPLHLKGALSTPPPKKPKTQQQAGTARSPPPARHSGPPSQARSSGLQPWQGRPRVPALGAGRPSDEPAAPRADPAHPPALGGSTRSSSCANRGSSARRVSL